MSSIPARIAGLLGGRIVAKLGLGLLFGYMLVVYLAAFVPAESALGNRCLPAHLQGRKHDDYYFRFLRWIPRAATSWCIESAPRMLLGNQARWNRALDGSPGPKPIPEPGEWQLSVVRIRPGWPLFLPYLAWTTSGGTHLRIGARWDDVDHYYTFPSIALAKPGRSVSTSVPD